MVFTKNIYWIKRNFFLLGGFVFLTFLHFAQSNSPYSSTAFGERGTFDHGYFSGLGNNTINYFDSTVLNNYNPASYNTLAKYQPIFSVGLSSKLVKTSSPAQYYNSFNAIMDHFSLGFRMNKFLGMSLGLKPYSRRAYEFSERVKVGDDSLKYTYLGNGGTNQVYLGISSTILNLKGYHWSIGLNGSYIFGLVNNERRSQIISSSSVAGGVEQNSIRLQSLNYEIGTYLSKTFAEKHTFTLSSVIEPGQRLNAKREQILAYSQYVDNPTYFDTLQYTPATKGKVTIPTNMTFGLNYSFKFKDRINKTDDSRLSQVTLLLQYHTADWSKYKTVFGGVETTTDLGLNNDFHVGVQYIPECNYIEKATMTSLIERMRYRAGFYYKQLPYQVNNQYVKDMALTVGFGFPILAQQSLSQLNIGFTFGKRGEYAERSIEEKYMGINISISIAPSSFDQWFRKRKLD